MQGSVEQMIAQQMANTPSMDKSLLDKLFAKEDIIKITEIHKKDNPSRQDMQELKQLLNGIESKLLNFDEDYPHILGRYFVRIMETFELYEATDDFHNKIKGMLTEQRTKELYETMVYKIKTTCLTYSSNFQWIERSSMSIEGSGFFNALTNKFEVAYPNHMQAPQVEDRSLLGRVFK